MTRWIQKELTLPRYGRGFHLVTNHVESVVPEIRELTVGLANVFIMHTSAALTLNENADPTVRADFEAHFNAMIPESAAHYRHVFEGSDDMPAHLKSSILGQSLTIPIKNGRLALGTWQGIYLCEHRNDGGRRHLVVTISGE